MSPYNFPLNTFQLSLEHSVSTRLCSHWRQLSTSGHATAKFSCTSLSHTTKEVAMSPPWSIICAFPPFATMSLCRGVKIMKVWMGQTIYVLYVNCCCEWVEEILGEGSWGVWVLNSAWLKRGVNFWVIYLIIFWNLLIERINCHTILVILRIW